MKTSIISGNYKVVINGDIDRDATVNLGSEETPKQANVGDVIDDCGVTYIVQRDGLGAFYKPRLKKGQKRNELAFSDDNAKALVKSLGGTLDAYGAFEVTVEEHVPTETASPMVRATAFVDSLMGDATAEGQLRSMLEVMGMEAADEADRDALIAFANSKGLGVNPPRAKKTPEATE